MSVVGSIEAAHEPLRRLGQLDRTHQRKSGRITEITEGPAAGIRGLYMRDPYGVIIELLETK